MKAPCLLIQFSNPPTGERSLILGTDKKGGLNVFDVDGHRLQIVSDGSRPNNVDLIYGFRTGREAVDLAVAGTRTRSRQGVVFWRIDPVTYAFVMTIDPQPAGTISDVGETDGIDVTNVAVSARFPRGLFVCQDGKNGRDGRQNFKYFAWEEIAGDRLIVDTKRPARSR